MSAVTMRALAAVLIVMTAIESSPAVPAKRWFLTLNAWSHSNASLTPGNKTTIHWEEAFETRDIERTTLDQPPAPAVSSS